MGHHCFRFKPIRTYKDSEDDGFSCCTFAVSTFIGNCYIPEKTVMNLDLWPLLLQHCFSCVFTALSAGYGHMTYIGCQSMSFVSIVSNGSTGIFPTSFHYVEIFCVFSSSPNIVKETFYCSCNCFVDKLLPFSSYRRLSTSHVTTILPLRAC